MMNRHFFRTVAATVTLAVLLPPVATAGTLVGTAPKDKVVEPVKKELPYGSVTFGGKFTEDVQTLTIDSLTPFWAPGDFIVYLNTRNKWSDNSQDISSYGLATRYLVPDREIILGVNAFYDSLHSSRGNDFDQLGLGVEVLTRWFDARANWYLPESELYAVESASQRNGEITTVGDFRNGDFFNRRIRETSDKRYTKRYEGALEGYNLEAGFLVPGLDRYLELRLLAGYYNLSGPFDKNYEGFKARAEARFLPGVIAGVEYWDDAEVMGGNWAGEIRVSIPFSLFNLARGRNPFEGTTEMFKPRQREFRERLSEQIIRSHTIQTATSDPIGAGGSGTSSTTDVVTGPVPKPPVERPSSTPPPPDGEGEACTR